MIENSTLYYEEKSKNFNTITEMDNLILSFYKVDKSLLSNLK